MSINLPVGGSIKFVAVYVDAQNNPTSPPPGAGQITWTGVDAAVMTLDTDIGGTVTATATGAVNATDGISVTDGAFTSPVEMVTVVAGPAVGLVIQAV